MSEDKNIEESKQVIIAKTDWEMMKARLDKLESGDKNIIPTIIKEHTANLRKFENKIVISLKNLRKIWDDRSREYVEFCDIITDDKKLHEEIDYLNFLRNSKKVKVKIKDTTCKEVIVNQGEVEIKKLDKQGYLVSTERYRPAEVISYIEKALIELPNGDKLKVDVNFLNM